jgi:hypothetical protein
VNIEWLSLLVEIANSGVESETRSYRVVQIDNDVWERIQAVKASVPFSDYPHPQGPMRPC